MFGRRGATVQERPVEEQKAPVQDVPRDDPGPQNPGYSAKTTRAPEQPTGYRRPKTVTTYEQPVSRQGTLSQEETIHVSSVGRTLMGRLLEYTGVALVLSELILLLRLSFNLADVSLSNGFVSWIFVTSGWMVKPFQGIFDNHIIRGGGIFEPANLIAIAVYLVGGLIIMALIGLFLASMPRRTRRVRYVEQGPVE